MPILKVLPTYAEERIVGMLDWYCRVVLEGGFCLVKPSNAHCYRRRQKRSYQLRKQRVKCFWLCAILGIGAFPMLHVAVIVGLFTTFISFMYLDEADA